MIVKHIAGIVLFIIHLQGNPVSSKIINGCDVGKDAFGKLAANCNNKGIQVIPRDLGDNIQVLDISNNNITVFKTRDLRKYLNLRTIIMINLTITSFPKKFFDYITQLTTLNMSNTQITNLDEIPGTLIVLNFTLSKSEHVDISHLLFLEELYMSNSGALKKIPALHKDAPLRIIDLVNSPLIEASYSQIAPFCLLEYFGCNSIELRKAQHVNQCCGLRKWAEKQGIKSGYQSQGCNNSGSDYSVCNSLNIDFDENSISEYNACYRIRELKVLIIVVLGIFILVLLGTLAGVFGHHLYGIYVKKSERFAEPESDEDITDGIHEKKDADGIHDKKDADGAHEKKSPPKKKVTSQEELAGLAGK